MLFRSLHGWGEVAVDAVPFYTSETVHTAMSIGADVLGPLALSRAWQSPGEFAAAAEAWRGHAFTKAAFETVLWDIAGQMEGRSVAAMLCGDTAPREWVEHGPSLGIRGEPERLVEDVAGVLAGGSRRIKVKVMPGADEDFLAAVRQRFPDITLMVDANAAYQPEDIPRLAAWDRFDLLMIEQPLPPDDLWFHRDLAARMRTPICLDESIESLHAARCAVAMGAADIVNIKVGRVGGLANTRRVHDLCAAAGIPVWIGSRLGSGIAAAMRLAAAALPNCVYPTDAGFGSRYLPTSLLQQPFASRNGRELRVPAGPGLGIAVDRDAVERYAVAQVTL